MAHLTSFTVENFKRFEHFEMSNIGQFNLIVGDNNVGKTSVLEALLVEKSPYITRYNLLKVLTEYRGIEKLRESYLRSFVRWGAWLKEDTIISSSEATLMMYPDKEQGYGWSNNGFIQKFDLSNDKEIRFDGTLRSDGTGIVHVPYIPFFLGYRQDIAVIYSAYIQESKQNKQIVINALQTLIPNIESVEINVAMAEEPTIVIWQTNSNFPAPLATLGDGTIKLFRILLNLFIHGNERIMIDEIDAGIHISRMRNFFKTILQTAIKHNVQIFATTHNWECLQVFKEVLEELEMQEYQARTRCFKLAEMPDGSVKSYTYEFDDFQYAMEARLDPREVWG